MSEFGCAVTFIIILFVIVMIPYTAGKQDGIRREHDRINYVITNHSETTATLIHGLRMITAGENPKTMDATLQKWGKL